jgi:peptide/nickel transport system ATP-binding protein
MLDVHRLTISFPSAQGEIAVVRNLSFRIEPGETLCLVGESGSGKSMTALALMGILPPDARLSGAISWKGEVITKDRALHRGHALCGSRMTMVFQEPMASLNPSMKVGQTLEEMVHCNRRRGVTIPTDAVSRALEKSGLGNLSAVGSAYPWQLSGGLAQRVVIASSLLLNPGLLIADEPTTALDVTTQARILQILLEQREQHGLAMLFITHDLSLARLMGGRTLVMKDGEELERGTTQDVLSEPRHPFTKELVEHGRALVGSVGSLHGRLSMVACPEGSRGDGRDDDGLPFLEVNSVTVSYAGTGFLAGPRFTALRDVSVGLHRGRCLAVVGESGSGKTTLARAISGLVGVETGTIRLGDLVTPGLTSAKWQQYRRLVQVVFQDPLLSLNPRMSVARQILEPVRHLPLAQRKERMEEVLRRVRLDLDLAAKRPAHLSGGQRQRACIARALMPHPELLIADEPVSALDLSVQAQIVQLLRQLKEEGLTLLLVSHDMDLVRFLADDVAVMTGGRIVEQGHPEDLAQAPLHPYTRLLLRAVPSGLDSKRIAEFRQLPKPVAMQGCPFWPNCDRATEECEVVFPSPRSRSPHRTVWCHHPLDD